ncbi:MAG TPA: hypothetical protein VN316_01705, partial [candidate division Zixibacteria bacterium]|nr:hypothetical protein [candidate division Zixibacteria bacterium]
GNGYAEIKSLTISASNALSIKKMVSNSILGEKIYPESYSGVGGIRSIKDVTYVNLKVENHQSYPIYGARLVDSLPPSFNFVDNENKTSISWLFDINASDFREFRYEIRAKRQGVYSLPKAELIWKEWGEEMHKESESPRTTVSGPYLGIDRSFSKTGLNIGEPLQVTVSLINNGDVPTNVTVYEILPQNASYLSGELSFSGFLNPGEQKNFKYNISLYRAGTLEFKTLEITSKNHGFDWYAPVPARKVEFLSSPSTASPPVTTPGNEQVHEIGIIQNINEKMPWLEGAVSMITLLFAIFLLLTLNRMNRIL